MRPLARTCRLTGLLSAVVVAVLVLPGPAAAADDDLAALQASLREATSRAAALGQDLQRSAARDGGLRVALERLEEQHDRARARLDARVRQVWIARRPDPLGGFTARLEATGLRRVTVQGAAAAVRVDRELVEAVAQESVAATALRAQALAARTRLAGQAQAALQAQEQARILLARAERVLAEQVSRERAGVLAERERSRQAALVAGLAAARITLDQASATVTAALTPAQTRRSQRAQAAEAPLVALVEAAGAGYPAGYVPTGEVQTGLASWYGPGFVGSPTATGAPYDPERLTCAHRTVPLGTVLRVSAHGRAINCLVNDRGPYVAPRLLDLSRAGSRTLGFDGVALVSIEVLAAARGQSTSR